MKKPIKNKSKKAGFLRLNRKARTTFIIGVPLLLAAFLFVFAIGNTGSSELKTSETISYKSTLVWRTEAQALKYGKGDYILPELDPGNTYELSEKIQTAGTITSMAVSWKFSGKVTMEISADGGSSYTSVVNGVPLETGFTAGNFFRWRATLGQDSKLYDIRVCLKDSSGAAGSFGNADISGFKHRKVLALSNSSQQELFNYQVKLKVASKAKAEGADIHCEGNVEKDFRDIRFTAADGETSLPYYIENIEGKSADIWVKVPQIPLEGAVIYIYYGNKEALSLSSAEGVFDFYDDFSSEELDETKWEVDTGLDGDYEIADSKLKLNSAGVLSKSYELKDGIIEYGAEPVSGYEVRFTVRTDKEGLSQTTYSSPYSGAEHCIAVNDIVQANEQKAISTGLEYNYKIIADGEDLTFERYYLGDKEASVSYKDAGGLSKGYIGLKAGVDNLTYYDWVRVRKYAESEPAIVEASQEKIKPAVFVNTAVSGNGNVTLQPAGDILAAAGKKYKAKGSYSFVLDPGECDINEIIPLVKGKTSGLTLDISADEGKTWLYKCENNQAYKAPLDFAKSNKLLVKVNFSSATGQTTPELSELALEYALGPVVRSENIKCTGASKENGAYVSGDTIVVEWDNSKEGDNNSDIGSVVCNFEAFGGAKETAMLDDGKSSDKKAGDDIYTAAYKISLARTTKITGNIFVTAVSSCGATTTDGHILTVDVAEAAEEEQEEEAEEEAQEEIKDKDLNKRYKIKFGTDEAEIGDFETRNFRPHAKAKRWGEECYFEVEIPSEYFPKREKEAIDRKGDKVEWDSSEMGGRFYKKPRQEVVDKARFVKNEKGGLEFEVILKKAPASGVISLPFKSEGLKFHYQAPLTVEQRGLGIIRPAEVEGSYAVYHDKNKDGNKYGAGKAFHIYRPKIIDADGNWIWGALKIDESQNTLIITIDETWLQTAAYPVIIDPEFGYMTVGSSAIPLGNITRGSIFTALVMNPDSITTYLDNTGASSHTAKFAIYKVSDLSLVAETAEVTIPAGTAGWYEGLYTTSPSLTAVEYALTAKSDSSDVLMYFDSGDVNQGVSQESTYASAWPNPADFSYNNNMYSIYDAETTTFSITATLDETGPTVTSATLNYDTGVLVITCDSTIDANPTTNVDLTKIHLNDETGTDDVTLTGATVTASEATTVTITLTGTQWVNALAISGVTGGNGDAVVLDVDADALQDMAANTNLIDDNNTVTETDITTGATKTWDNGGSGSNWSTGENWNPDGRPGVGDLVVFDGTSNTACTADDVADNLASITMDSSSYTSTVTFNKDFVEGSNTLTLTGNLTVNYGTILCEADNDGDPTNGAGIIIVADNITVGANGTISANGQGFGISTGPGQGVDNGDRASGAGHGSRGGDGLLSQCLGGSAYGSYTEPTSIGSGGGDDSNNPSTAGVGGGAIKLDATGGTVTVNGTVSANGTSATNADAGGGSGGSVWIICDTLAGTTGTISADGGSNHAPSYESGGGGSGGRIALDYTNSTYTGTIKAAGGAGRYEQYYTYGCHGTLYIPDGEDLTVSANIALASGTYNIPNLTVSGTATLECQSDHDGDPTNGAGVVINATNVTVDYRATISADRLGFEYGEGPAKGGDGTMASGGGHGGDGGKSDNQSVVGGFHYGSVSAPDTIGSPGGRDSVEARYGGNGGGAIKIIASGTVTINGEITADGGDAIDRDPGGGAGGSIWIDCDTLTGYGFITANGGNRPTSRWGGGGGGGRIALYSSHNASEFAAVTADGGEAYFSGQDGSIIWSPIGGYTDEHIIPAAQCVQSTAADGIITVNFKAKQWESKILGISTRAIIVDDTSATRSGSWTQQTANNEQYGTSEYYSAIGTGNDTCTWTPTITTAGNYNVYAWWRTASNRSEDAPYTIYYNGGSETVDVDQEAVGDLWYLLGTYNFTAGTDGYVVLTDNASTGDVVVADAVAFDLAFDLASNEIILDGDDLVLSGAGWVELTTNADQYGTNEWYNQVASEGTDTCTWTPTITTAGDYNVYAWWSPFGNRSQDAPYTINYAGSGSVTVDVNQELPGAGTPCWYLLGTYSFDAGTSGNVVLTDETNGDTDQYVMADAVRFVLASQEIIVDNEDAEYVGTLGSVWLGPLQSGYGGERYVAIDNTSSTDYTCTWRPTIPSGGGDYHVYIRYSSNINRARDATYTVNHSTGSETFQVNQEENGNIWYDLGVYSFDEGTSGYVRLTDNSDNQEAGQYIMADDVRFTSLNYAYPSADYVLHTFKYSVDGTNFNPPTGGDSAEGVFSTDWTDNDYIAYSTFPGGTAHSFTFDTQDDSVTGLDIDQDDVRVKFTVRNVVDQEGTSYNVDSREELISANFSVNNAAPTITSAALNYDTGVLTITCNEAIDADPVGNVDLSKIHINNVTGTDDVTLTGATVTASEATTVVITLTQTQLTSALAISGVTGGDSGAVVLDVDAAALQDMFGNTNLIDDNNTVTETDITAETKTWDDSTGDHKWSTGDNWTPAGSPGAGDAVVFDGTSNTVCTADDVANNLASITMDSSSYTSTVTFNEDFVSGSNTLTLTGNLTVNYGTILCKADNDGDPENGTGIVINAANVTLGANGTISADEEGFAGGAGPGQGGDGSRPSGASHGGRGAFGTNKTVVPGDTYGSFDQPVSIGSGGGNDLAGEGGAGGGAIKIDATGGTVTIAGTISADGADATTFENTGGSGGSIWIIANTLAGSGTISAKGGNGANTVAAGGGGGRVALSYTAKTFDGTISLDGGTNSDDSDDDYKAHCGTFSFPDNEDVTVNGSFALISGTYNIPALTVTNNATLECQSDDDGDPVNGAGVVLTCTTVTVNSGAAISADQLGFMGSTGPGAPASNSYAAGGSHGGKGGDSLYRTSYALDTYGVYTAPTSIGSGGGLDSMGGSGKGGPGGGAIKINASGAVTINGTITADGDWGGNVDSGGGAGGSIWIIANTLAGSGTISADGGGTIAGNGGGGGGGRIALDYTSRSFSGIISAAGAIPTNTDVPGHHGTLYIDDFTSSLAALTVNGNIALSAGTYNITDITITNNATLECQGDNDGDPVNGAGVVLNCTNLTLDNGAAISANGLGFTSGSGPGEGADASHASGAGYGGRGAWDASLYNIGGGVYGSMTAPDALGSGGGLDVQAGSGIGGSGGGAIKINASGTVTINGTISADGDYGGYMDSGGGSGGSIWIICDTLAGGNGMLTANGGDRYSTYSGGSGGGGRIAVYYSHADYNARDMIEKSTVSAGSSNYDSQEGTVVWSPVGGYDDSENVIPSAQCAQSTGGDGVITVSFKAQSLLPNINGLDGFAVIMDDDDATYSPAWTEYDNQGEGYGNSLHYTASGDGSSTCTWRPNIPLAGNYKVYACWDGGSNRATDAPYTINYNGGSETVDKNQVSEANNFIWQLLGTYSFAEGTTGTVVLTNDADGNVIADAVAFEYVLARSIAEVVVDEDDATFVGTWTSRTGDTAYDGDYERIAIGSGDNTCTWRPDLSSAGAGNYRVYVMAPAATNHAGDAPYTIYYNGGSDTIDVNQHLSDSAWLYLGTYSFAGDTSGYIVLTDGAQVGEYVIADAVRLLSDTVNVETEVVMPNVTEAGSWNIGSTGGYATGERWKAAGTGTASITWRPTVSVAGEYDVKAYWREDTDNVSDAEFTVYYDGGSETIDVDQRTGNEWYSLGRYDFDSGTGGYVVLTDNSDDTGDNVRASAIRLTSTSYGYSVTNGYTLDTFYYSINGGDNWSTPTNGDSSTCLSTGWADNSGADYLSDEIINNATAYSFTWDTKHADLGGALNDDQDDIKVKFTIRNSVNQGLLTLTSYNIDSKEELISEAFTVDNVAPSQSTGVNFTATGGTVVSNYINSTNTGFTVNFTSPATSCAGTAHLYLGGADFTTPITTPVSAVSTSYDLNGNSTSITELGADGAKALTVVIVDSVGNVGTASSAANITKDTDAPGVSSATLDYDDGTLVITCDEEIDANPAGNVTLSGLHINDSSGTDDVTLSSGTGATVTASELTTVTITLTEAQRLAALALSGLLGGNGGAVVLDVDAGALQDLAGNTNAIDDGNAVTESGTTSGTKLSFGTAPTTPVTAGTTWDTFTVNILDASDGRTIATDTVTITPSTSSFTSGTASKAAVGGVATFDDLVYSAAGVITVTASADGLTSVQSGNITIDTGDATQVVVIDPTDGDVDSDISVTIQIQDSEGNVVSIAQDITVTVDGDALISGVTTGTGDGSYNSQSETVTSSAGGIIVVTLHDETPETVNINVDHTTLTDTSTQDVVFDNGAATQVVITDPTDGDVDSDISVTIQVQDQYDNLVDDASESVTVTVDNNALISGVTTGTGDASYDSQSEAVTSDGGVIVVTLHDETPETVNINVDHATLTDTSTQDVVFDNGAATQVVITDPTDGTVDADISVTIQVLDQYDNLVDDASESVTVTVDNNALISGVTTGTGDASYNSQSEAVTSDSGVIVVTLHDETPETPNINVDHATLTDTSTQNVVFQHGAGDHLKFSSDITGTINAGVVFSLPSITAVDQYDNTLDNGLGATAYSGAKTISYDLSGTDNAPDGAGSGTDTYTTSVSFTNGVSTTSPIQATLHCAQEDVTLTPSEASLTGTNIASNAFTINPDTKTKVVYATAPSTTGTINANLSTPPVVEIRDVYGNRTADTDTITIYDSTSGSSLIDAAGTLTGNSLSATAGSATFTNLQYSLPGAIYLYAEASGLTGAYSDSVTFSVSGDSTVDAADTPVSNFNLTPSNDADVTKFEVLKFKVTDAGGDSTPTLLDRVQVSVAMTGTAVISDIAWAGLYVGATKVADSASIESGYITFGSAPDAESDADLSTGDLDIIAESSSTEFIVYVYMKDTKLTATEDDTFTFDIDESLIGEDTNLSSQMASDSTAITAVVGTVTVDTTHVEVVTEAGATSMSLTAGTASNIKLRAVDANRNVDEDYVSAHTFKFSGTLSGSGANTPETGIDPNYFDFGINRSFSFTAGESATTGLRAFVKETDKTVSVTEQVATPPTCFPLSIVSVAAADGASISVSSGNNQIAAINRTLPASCVALVSDAYGNPATGTTIAFAVSTSPANGASVSPASAGSDADGLVSFDFTMGSVAQNYSATATNAGLTGSPLTFTATALSPDDINIVSGGPTQNIQVTQDAAELVVELLASAAAVPNEDVGFAITSQPSGASASLSVASDTTDTNGQASTVLTLGNKIGDYVVTASWGGLTEDFTITGTPDSPYKVVLSGPSSVTAGSPSTVFTVEVQDQYDNASPVDTNSTFTLATTQSSTGGFYSDSAGENAIAGNILSISSGNSSGVFYYKDTLADASAPDISATLASGQSGMTTTADSQSITVNPAALNYFTVTSAASTAMTAGGTRTITVTAYDEYDNLKTNYTGSQDIVFSGANSSPSPTSQAPTCSNSTPADVDFGSATALDFSSGTVDTTLKVYKAESAAIKATAGSATTSAANDYDVVVMHGSADHLKFSGNIPSPQTAGASFDLEVYADAVDIYSNLCDGANGATAYSGTKTVTWTLSGTSNGPEGNADVFSNPMTFTAGRTTAYPTATLYRAQDTTITPSVADLSGTNVASNTITINPSSVNKLKFTQQPSATSTTSQVLSQQPIVSVADPYGNVYTTASSNITLRASLDNVTYTAVSNGTLSADDLTKGLTNGSAAFSGVTYDYPEAIYLRAEESNYSLTPIFSSLITFDVAEEAGLAASAVLTEPTTIASTVTTEAGKLDMLDFKVSDAGADNIGTKIKQITITRSGDDTTGDWTNYIAGAYITDGTTQTIGVVSANALTFGSGTSVIYTAADGGDKTFTLSLYLRGSLPSGADNKVLGFSIDADSDISLDAIGSQFPATSALTSTTTIAITATHFKVTGSASMTAGAENVITVRAIDTSGNIDVDFSGDKDLVFGGANDSPDGEYSPTCTNYGGAAIDFGSATPTTFTSGVSSSTITMVLYRAETAAVTATLSSMITTAANALSVVVSGGAAGELAWGTAPISPTVANAPWKGFTVEVTDTFGNDTSSTPLITITPTGGTVVSGNTATAASGVATFNGFAVTCASYPGSVTIAATADGVTGTGASDPITVAERYAVTVEVKDYTSAAHINVDTLTITNSSGTSMDYLQTTTGVYTCNLPYGYYNLNLTKEAYLTEATERTAGVSEDGADGSYDNDITWDITVTSLTEATADYNVKSGFVYNQNNDTLDVRVWLERRGILIVNDATNKLGDATIEIYGDTSDPALATFTIDGPDASDTTSGVYYRKITNATDGTGIITLTSGQMYYTKCFIGYGGSDGTSRTYQSGTTFEVGVASLVRIATDQIEGLSTEIRGEVTGVITSVEAQALLTQAAVAAQATTTQALVTSKVASAVTSIGGSVSISEAAIKSLMSIESASRILNQDSTVKQNDTMKIRYKTTTGMTPTIDVYDANNTKRVDAATMTETVSGSGIYEYSVKFQWGVGQHTVICKETTGGTLDGINVLVITTDLEAISSAATTTMGQVSNIDTDSLEAVPASISSITSVINSVSASLDDLSALSTKIKDSATSAVQNMYDELSLASEKMKEISAGQGLKIDAMYEVSGEQSTNVDYIKNKTQEIKAMVELQKEIIESESEIPVVTSWLESSEEGIEAPMTIEGFEAQLEAEIGAEAEVEQIAPESPEKTFEEGPLEEEKEEETESEFESMGEPEPMQEPAESQEPREIE